MDRIGAQVSELERQRNHRALAKKVDHCRQKEQKDANREFAYKMKQLRTMIDKRSKDRIR